MAGMGSPVSLEVAPTFRVCLLIGLIATPLLPVTQEPASRVDAPITLRLTTEGAAALVAGELETAERRFEEALAASPGFISALLGLSEVYKQRGELMRALETAQRAEQLHADSAATLVAVGSVLAELGQPAKALDKLRPALELEPQNVRATLLSAHSLRDLGRAEEAIDLLASARAAGLTDAVLAEQLGYLLLASSQVEGALKVAEPAVASHPEDAGLHLVVGLALARTPEKRTEAGPWLRRAIDLGAANGEIAYLELASLLVEGGQVEEAISLVRTATALYPDSPAVQRLLATALRSKGDLEAAAAAEERYERLTEASDDRPRMSDDIRNVLIEAQTLAKQGSFSAALETVDGLLARYSDQPQALALRAKILLSMGRGREALTVAVEAREQAPGWAEFHYLEGLLLSGFGRPGEAESALRRALALDTEMGDAHALLGAAIAKQNRPSEAVDSFQRALDLGVDNASLRLGYSAALESLGRSAEAAAQMEAYRRLQE